MRKFLLVGLLVLPRYVLADTTETTDTQVTGQIGVGTFQPRATLEVKMSTANAFALKVSSASSGALFGITNEGKASVGLGNPQARFDVNGKGDNGNIGLQLRVGNSSSTTLGQQLVFASTAGTYGHSIATHHNQAQALGNSMDFFLWDDDPGQPYGLGSFEVLSLQAVFTSTASMHVNPFGDPDVELEVSDGFTTGGGAIHRAAAAAHSSRELKTDIVYFTEAQNRQAYADVKTLKHATFRYKTDGNRPLRRGLIYEDTPESIRGSGKTVVLDYRVLNLEMALKEADKRIKALEAEISEKQKRKTGGKK